MSRSSCAGRVHVGLWKAIFIDKSAAIDTREQWQVNEAIDLLDVTDCYGRVPVMITPQCSRRRDILCTTSCASLCVRHDLLDARESR